MLSLLGSDRYNQKDARKNIPYGKGGSGLDTLLGGSLESHLPLAWLLKEPLWRNRDHVSANAETLLRQFEGLLVVPVPGIPGLAVWLSKQTSSRVPDKPKGNPQNNIVVSLCYCDKYSD